MSQISSSLVCPKTRGSNYTVENTCPCFPYYFFRATEMYSCCWMSANVGHRVLRLHPCISPEEWWLEDSSSFEIVTFSDSFHGLSCSKAGMFNCQISILVKNIRAAGTMLHHFAKALFNFMRAHRGSSANHYQPRKVYIFYNMRWVHSEPWNDLERFILVMAYWSPERRAR